MLQSRHPHVGALRYNRLRIITRGADRVAKLVRDRIPDLIRASGRTPRVRTLSADEYRAALDAKLDEEVAELRAADTPDAVMAEAADIVEVLASLVALHGASVEDILAAAAHKRSERGGFDGRVWLELEDRERL
jgi:predicted house-cleaning noncanonical NTP pyrophosphatase (MazG superfamily)